MKIKNIIGERFGRLVVLRMLEERGNTGQIRYECICDCGNIHITTGDCLRSGKTKSCGCLKRDFIDKNKFPRNEDRECEILKSQYSHLKRRNKKKGFDDVIDFEIYKSLVKSECYYCGRSYSRILEDRSSESKKKKKITDTIVKINGIDRIDSSKGYTRDNCVSCCKYCNTAKSTMSQFEFAEWIMAVYNKFILKIHNAM